MVLTETVLLQRSIMSTHEAPLPQGAGYGVVVGLGVTFALGMQTVESAQVPLLMLHRNGMGNKGDKESFQRG